MHTCTVTFFVQVSWFLG